MDGWIQKIVKAELTSLYTFSDFQISFIGQISNFRFTTDSIYNIAS